MLPPTTAGAGRSSGAQGPTLTKELSPAWVPTRPFIKYFVSFSPFLALQLLSFIPAWASESLVESQKDSMTELEWTTVATSGAAEYPAELQSCVCISAAAPTGDGR